MYLVERLDMSRSAQAVIIRRQGKPTKADGVETDSGTAACAASDGTTDQLAAAAAAAAAATATADNVGLARHDVFSDTDVTASKPSHAVSSGDPLASDCVTVANLAPLVEAVTAAVDVGDNIAAHSSTDASVRASQSRWRKRAERPAIETLQAYIMVRSRCLLLASLLCELSIALLAVPRALNGNA